MVTTTTQLHSTKPELRFYAGSNPASRWWGSLAMVPAGNKAKRLSSVNHTTKTIHHHWSSSSASSSSKFSSLWSYRGFLCNNKEKSMRRVLCIDRKIFFFPIKDSYIMWFRELSITPEFSWIYNSECFKMCLIVPTVTYPSWVISCCAASIKPISHILHPLPSLFRPWPGHCVILWTKYFLLTLQVSTPQNGQTHSKSALLPKQLNRININYNQ